MSFWRRIGSTGIESLIYRRKERFFPVGGVSGPSDFRSLEESFSRCKPIFCYTHFRSFMASDQVKPKPRAEGKGADWRKPKVEEDVGVRLNEAIRETEVRLVTDQGHRVVLMQEALYLARKHNLDLVEVQRKVKVEGGSQPPVFKPAVCKLMDYYKEKYKLDVKGKERAKSHATIALRNGENKEVRFKAKTELKDLKIKAESVKRLMERGYRVKCTAMHTGKDDEDLGVLLLNLLQLIEDISVVESGPHLDTKNAYVIVKHIKFTSKKGNKVKAIETVKSALSSRPITSSDTSSADNNKDKELSTEKWETVESDSETVIEASSKQIKPNTQHLDDIKPETGSNTKPVNSIFRETIPISVSHTPEQPEQINRYSRGSNGTFPAKRDGVYPGRFVPGNRGRVMEQTGSNGRYDHGQLNPKNRPAYTSNPDSSPPPRYGYTRASQNSDPNTPTVPQQRYGGFSPKKSPPPVNDQFNRSNSPAPSYGIFSSPIAVSSSDKPSNGSPPSPKFGVFKSSKKA